MDIDDDLVRTTDRTLALLWRRVLGEPQGARGPKQRVSVDEVVTAAVATADEVGLGAFSMRKVAERLGLGAMSVYTYVPGRSELIGLMVDEVAGELPLPSLPGGTRERLAGMAAHAWDEYHRHPWLLHIDNNRPWIGPHLSARYEWQLAAIEGLGLSDIEMDQVVTLVAVFTAGAARESIVARSTTEASGISDAEWWQINAPILERVMDATQYPVSGRVGSATGEAYNAVSAPGFAFDFGLARIIDGVQLLIESKSPVRRRP